MKLLGMMFSRTGAMILMIAAVLSACTVVVEEDGPGPRPRPPQQEPGFCTREYAPVCGQRRGERQTFANSCLADQAGYRIVRDGPCRTGGGDGGGDGGGTFCTREYAPVCARRGDRLKTFPNACEAGAADYFIIDNGPC